MTSWLAVPAVGRHDLRRRRHLLHWRQRRGIGGHRGRCCRPRIVGSIVGRRRRRRCRLQGGFDLTPLSFSHREVRSFLFPRCDPGLGRRLGGAFGCGLRGRGFGEFDVRFRFRFARMHEFQELQRPADRLGALRRGAAGEQTRSKQTTADGSAPLQRRGTCALRPSVAQA